LEEIGVLCGFVRVQQGPVRGASSKTGHARREARCQIRAGTSNAELV
jgi:hypothetical protein